VKKKRYLDELELKEAFQNAPTLDKWSLHTWITAR
jgi:hypothetical protein